jgi:hypothetical protein
LNAGYEARVFEGLENVIFFRLHWGGA